MTHAGRRVGDRRGHRPQRRRQDHDVQHHHRLLPARQGSVWFKGRDVTGLDVHERTALGMGRTFQNVGLVKSATVRENLLTAQHLEAGYSALAGMVGLPSTFVAERRLAARADALAEILGLGDLLDSRVAGLPYGVLKRVELGAVLATDPDLLLLDEPTLGHGPRGGPRLRRHAAGAPPGVRPDRGDDRAPRAAGGPGLRLRLLPQLRRAAGRGHARPGPLQPRGDPGLPGPGGRRSTGPGWASPR